MTDFTDPECHACHRVITSDAEAVQQQNKVTLEWRDFHAHCWETILEERRTRPARDAMLLAEHRRQAIAGIAYRFESCALGPEGFDAQLPKWEYARFGNEAFRKLASPIILEALERWVPGDGSLILSARTGAGKTAASVALMHLLRADAEAEFDMTLMPRFLFVTAAQLSAARRHQKLGTGESYLIEQAMCRDLIVLDEIGFEPLDGVSFEVIDTRYRKQLPTIVTSGLAPKNFAERYGSAAWRRLTESGAVIEDHGARKLAVAR
jgi:hypothetical protein